MTTRRQAFDMTHQNKRGFTVVPPGRYPVEVVGWEMHTKANENEVHWIDLRILTGKFENQTLRYFHTVTSAPESPGYFTRMVKDLGLIKDDDRTSEGEHGFEIEYGPVKDTPSEDQVEDVLSIVPMGQEEGRSVLGVKGTAVVINRKVGGDTEHSVQYLNAYEDSDPAEDSGEEDRAWV